MEKLKNAVSRIWEKILWRLHLVPKRVHMDAVEELVDELTRINEEMERQARSYGQTLEEVRKRLEEYEQRDPKSLKYKGFPVILENRMELKNISAEKMIWMEHWANASFTLRQMVTLDLAAKIGTMMLDEGAIKLTFDDDIAQGKRIIKAQAWVVVEV